MLSLLLRLRCIFDKDLLHRPSESFPTTIWTVFCLREEEPRTYSSLFDDHNHCDVAIPLEYFWEDASVGEGGGKHGVPKFLNIEKLQGGKTENLTKGEA